MLVNLILFPNSSDEKKIISNIFYANPIENNDLKHGLQFSPSDSSCIQLPTLSSQVPGVVITIPFTQLHTVCVNNDCE